MRHALAAAFFIASSAAFAGDYDWRQEIELTQMRELAYESDDFGSSFYLDIMRHTDNRVLEYSPATNAHETNHMLTADARNAGPSDHNAVYFENGQVAIVPEPQMQAALIAQYLPDEVKTMAMRYQLYLVEQVGQWPNVLYQFDEWSAYRTDARVAVEADRSGRIDDVLQGEVCIIDGPVEFLYFASAAIAALAENEPAYLRDRQFKAVFAMLAEQTMEYVAHTRGRSELACDTEALLTHLRTSPDAKAESIRSALQGMMDPAWTMRVLGF